MNAEGGARLREASAAEVDAALAGVLPAGSLFAVGGRVRDEIRSELDGVTRIPKDLDYIVTGVSLESLLERLRRAGRADTVGASFAVVKCTLLGRTVDVALPRRERSTGVLHGDFDVEFGSEIPLEEDLARRDFRMNMMARRIGDHAVVDPYGGEEDVRARRIDLLRLEAFVEDPLRMLRAAQFAARFEYDVTERTMDAMRAAASTATTVSPERTRDELVKLLESAPSPSRGIEILREGGVLVVVLPEILEGFGVEQNVYHAHDVYGHNLATLDAVPPGDLTNRLAALLHDVGKPRVKDGPHFYRHEEVGAEMTREILARLHFPNETIDRVEKLVAHHMYVTDAHQTDAAVRRFIRRIGPDLIERQFSLRAADIAGSGLPKRDDANERFESRVWAEVARSPAVGVSALAVDGKDAIAAIDRARNAGSATPDTARRGSPLVGEMLRWLLEAVIEDPELNRRETLLEMMGARATEILKKAD